jgi:hypothetical protein
MGYVNDHHMCQFIPPTAFHCVTGTWTDAAGQIAGTISRIKAAGAETSVINIPIVLPSNSVALKGSFLESVEIDYEIRTAALTSLTASMNKITRGVDTAVAVVAAVTVTQDLAAGVAAATVDQHKLTVTLTTPVWIDNDEEVLLKLSAVCAAGSVLEFLGAVANFRAKL